MSLSLSQLFAALAFIAFATAANAAGLDLFLPQNLLGSEVVNNVHVTHLGTTTVKDPSILEYANDCTDLAKDENGDDLEPNIIDAADLGKIINIGRKLWKIVEDNEPIYEVNRQLASALPKGIKCWNELENWQAPKSAHYGVAYDNLWGMTVVDFSFRLNYTYGGQYRGKGKFLNNLSITPSLIDVVLAYHFYADVEVPQVVNLGSSTDPVAGAEINLNWRVETALKKSQNNVSFFVDGEGNLEKL